MHTAPPTARISRDATRFTVTVRRLDDAPEIAQLVELHDDNATLTRGRDAVFAAITRALARGERLELVPVVRSVSSESDDAAGLRAAVLHDPASRSETSSTLSLQTPQDMHLLGLRLERPSSRAAREVYATLLGVDVGELRGAENRGVWRWYVSDRTVRWAPLEGAPAVHHRAHRVVAPQPKTAPLAGGGERQHPRRHPLDHLLGPRSPRHAAVRRGATGHSGPGARCAHQALPAVPQSARIPARSAGHC